MGGKKHALEMVVWILLFIGGLNWGLVGAFDWNLVNAIFGSVSWLERIIYVLVGLAALASLKHCAACKTTSAPAQS